MENSSIELVCVVCTTPRTGFSFLCELLQKEGILGIKAPLHDLNKPLSDATYIFLFRSDVENQARSYITAKTNNEWGSHQPYLENISDAELYRTVMEIEAQEAAWEDWFVENEIKPLYVSFERLIEHPQSTVREIKLFLEGKL